MEIDDFELKTSGANSLYYYSETLIYWLEQNIYQLYVSSVIPVIGHLIPIIDILWQNQM